MVRLTCELHYLLSDTVLEVLRKRQICTCLDLFYTDNSVLEKISSLTFQELQQLKRHLVKQLSMKPINALDCYKNVIANSAIFKTGILTVDDLLKGGILTGNVLEITGLPASGKSSFCIKFIQTNIKTGCSIYVVDTKNDISPRRMLHTDPIKHAKSLMQNLFINKISNKYEFVQSLFDARRMIENGTKIRILVIDSLAALFLDSNNTTENNSILNTVANIFRFFINEYHLSVVVTNLISEWRDQKVNRETSASGKFWATVPNIRLRLQKNEDIVRATLLRDDNYSNVNKTCFYNLQDNVNQY